MRDEYYHIWRISQTKQKGEGMKHRRPKSLYGRATVVVVNDEGHILLVKHNRQHEWALLAGDSRPPRNLAAGRSWRLPRKPGLPSRNPHSWGATPAAWQAMRYSLPAPMGRQCPTVGK